MAYSFGFRRSERKKTATTVATNDFEKEYQKFIEEQKKIKQEREAAKTVVETQNVQASEETIAAVNAIIEATEAAEQEQTDKVSKKKKKKSVEETVEL